MGQKANLPKQSSHWEKMLQLGRPFMACIGAKSRQIVRMKKSEKIDCYVMHLKNLIKSKRESRKNVDKMMKNCKNTNHFSSCKELLFSLGDCVWNEKWPSFIILHWYRKLSDSLPFEPDNFSFNNPTEDHPHTGGQKEKGTL